MATRDEGVIKFECRWRKTPPPPAEEIHGLIQYRQRLFALGLIGVYPDGVGFGNISMRGIEGSKFVISASQTGHLTTVGAKEFVRITDYSIENNWLECEGQLQASSESLTHAMVYDVFPECKAVIHVHSASAWNRLINRVPTTHASVPYGTPAMALEVRRLAGQTNLNVEKIFVMAGHEEGIISFGTNLEESFDVLIENISTR